METAFWLSVSVLVALGLSPVVWVVRSALRERRKARFAAEMAAYSRKMRTVVPDGEPTPDDQMPSKQITVAELVARIEAEGLAVRLGWKNGNRGSRSSDDGGGEWPTGLLPRDNRATRGNTTNFGGENDFQC
jgi:hypothetical protein